MKFIASRMQCKLFPRGPWPDVPASEVSRVEGKYPTLTSGFEGADSSTRAECLDIRTKWFKRLPWSLFPSEFTHFFSITELSSFLLGSWLLGRSTAEWPLWLASELPYGKQSQRFSELSLGSSCGGVRTCPFVCAIWEKAWSVSRVYFSLSKIPNWLLQHRLCFLSSAKFSRSMLLFSLTWTTVRWSLRICCTACCKIAAFVCFFSVGGSSLFKLVNPKLMFCILLRSIMLAFNLRSLSVFRTLHFKDLRMKKGKWMKNEWIRKITKYKLIRKWKKNIVFT